MRFIAKKTFQFIQNSQTVIVIKDLVKKVAKEVEEHPKFKLKINKTWNQKEGCTKE
jgi:hypothetical protein